MFQQVDPSFLSRGASTRLLFLLLLRRIRLRGAPAVIFLDNLPADWGALPQVIGPFLDPGQVLPEGPQGLPPLAVVLAGNPGSVLPAVPQIVPPERFLVETVAPFTEEELAEITARWCEAVALEPPEAGAMRRLEGLVVTRGGGASLLMDLLREAREHALRRGASRISAADVVVRPASHGQSDPGQMLDCYLLETVRSGTGGDGDGWPISDLRDEVHRRCRAEGLAYPSEARLWRHLARMERAGILRRVVRFGGPGGTKSRVYPGIVPAPRPAGTRNDAGLEIPGWLNPRMGSGPGSGAIPPGGERDPPAVPAEPWTALSPPGSPIGPGVSGLPGPGPGRPGPGSPTPGRPPVPPPMPGESSPAR